MRTRTTSRVTKAAAAGLVLSLTQLALGGGLTRAASTPAAAAPPAKTEAAPRGHLATRGDGVVSVDGARARTGQTVFSGQQIQTPAGVGATVGLGRLGRLDMAPESSLTLSFGDSRVVARVAGGCVVLTAGEGVEGVVETGATTEKAQAASIDMCVDPADGVALKGAAADAGVGAQQNPPQDDDDDKKKGGVIIPGGGAGGAGGGLGTGAALAITTAAVGTFALVSYYKVSGRGCRRGRNFSPTVPRGPSDECP